MPLLDIQPEKLTGTSWADDAADDMFNTCLACSVGEYIKAPHVLSCLARQLGLGYGMHTGSYLDSGEYSGR